MKSRDRRSDIQKFYSFILNFPSLERLTLYKRGLPDSTRRALEDSFKDCNVRFKDEE